VFGTEVDRIDEQTCGVTKSAKKNTKAAKQVEIATPNNSGPR